MNAVELYHADGKPAGVWYCSQCRIVHRTKDAAEQCCGVVKCACGAECERYYTTCIQCIDKREAANELSKFEKAEKVTVWDGWVYSEGLGFQDGYFQDVESLLDHCVVDEIQPPAYCWACNPIWFAHVDVGQVLDWINDGAYEDFDSDTLSGVEDLKAALEVFNAANKDVCSYEPNYSKAVLLDTRKTGEWLWNPKAEHPHRFWLPSGCIISNREDFVVWDGKMSIPVDPQDHKSLLEDEQQALFRESMEQNHTPSRVVECVQDEQVGDEKLGLQP